MSQENVEVWTPTAGPLEPASSIGLRCSADGADVCAVGRGAGRGGRWHGLPRRCLLALQPPRPPPAARLRTHQGITATWCELLAALAMGIANVRRLAHSATLVHQPRLVKRRVFASAASSLSAARVVEQGRSWRDSRRRGVTRRRLSVRGGEPPCSLGEELRGAENHGSPWLLVLGPGWYFQSAFAAPVIGGLRRSGPLNWSRRETRRPRTRARSVDASPQTSGRSDRALQRTEHVGRQHVGRSQPANRVLQP